MCDSVPCRHPSPGPQTLFGARLHHSDPACALAAGVGADLLPECTAWLQAAGISTAALQQRPGARTPRAWQVLERDGRRTQLWRTADGRPPPDELLRPPLDSLPPFFLAASAYHIGIHPNHFDAPYLARLRRCARAAAGDAGLLSVETFTGAHSPLPDGQLAELCSAGDIFSPNEAEALSVLGATDLSPAQICGRFAAAGAAVVALRRGAEGAFVLRADTGEAWSIPALAEAAVVDPTGVFASHHNKWRTG